MSQPVAIDDAPALQQSRFRFKLRSLMIAVAAVAVLLVVMRSPTALAVAILLQYLVVMVSVWWLFRGFRRLSALSFGLVVAVTTTLLAAFSILLLNLGGFFLIMIGCVMAYPIIIGTGVAWALAATRRIAMPRRSPLLVWPLVLILALLPLSIPITFWPFRLAFLVSRPALDRLADRVAAGQAVATPEWAGLFRVIGSAVDAVSRNVGLITDSDRSGRSGFVRGSPGGPFFNLNLDLPLHDDWTYECED